MDLWRIGAKSTASKRYNLIMASLYVLSLESLPEKVRYVGITKHEDAEVRLRTHKANTTRNTDAPLYKWMRKYDNKVIATVLENGLSWEEACKKEVLLIAEYKSKGHELLNLTDGGEGLFNPSSETRRKISLTHKGKVLSEETREKIAAHNRGLSHSEETKKKMSESHRGKPAWNKNKQISESHRQNIVNSLKGRTVSQETKDKIRESNLGQKRSQEAIDNMKEAQRKRREREEQNEAHISD